MQKKISYFDIGRPIR